VVLAGIDAWEETKERAQVACGRRRTRIEFAVFMRRNICGLIARAGQSPPYEQGLKVGNVLSVERASR